MGTRGRTATGPSEVKVWLAPRRTCRGATATASLTRPEQVHLATIGSAARRAEYVQGRALLRRVRSPGTTASLAHCPTHLAASATPDGRVGIDVESAPACLTRVADRYFDSAQLDWLHNVPERFRGRAFRRLWTLGEALFKAGAHTDTAIVPVADTGACGRVRWGLFEPTSRVTLAWALVADDDVPVGPVTLERLSEGWMDE